jgi:BirA family biotin operon repressor/biotin-[acetyl-CoA-carboxylase] ligase
MTYFPNADSTAEEVLTVLGRLAGRPISLQRLATELQLEEPRVERAIAELRGMGYEIGDSPSGFLLNKRSWRLVPAEIENDLGTSLLGKTIHCFEHLDSTNERAGQLADQGAADGTLVIAERQLKGRGRLAREWFSPPGLGIWLSLILRPKINPADAPGLSLVTALALADTIEEQLKIPAKLKWPNDCLLGGKKTAGILTELSAEQGRVDFVILGVGINVGHRQEDFPPELQDTATSLALAAKTTVDRVEFLQAFLRRLELDYLQFGRVGLGPTIGRYESHCSLIGCDVKVRIGKRVIHGRAVRIDPGGGLVISAAGSETLLTAGEVTGVREAIQSKIT